MFQMDLKNKQPKLEKIRRNDNQTIRHFNRFAEKFQTLFTQYTKSKHVIFTTNDKRTLYILYLSKIHELTIYKNHQCHVCVIYDRENIITMDINTRFPASDPMQSYMKHAEVNAVQNLIRTSSYKCDQTLGLIVVRFSKTGILNYSRPCFFCARFIKKHINYFHSISFSNQDEKLTTLTADEFKLCDFNHKTQRFN